MDKARMGTAPTSGEGMTDHDEPNCDPTVDCKFVGPRDCPCRCHSVASEDDNERAVDPQERTSGATFMVNMTAFRCIDIIGTFTPLYECNRCSAVVTDPERHLARAANLRARQDEVERLREDCAEWERLHDQAERLCARCGSELDHSEPEGTHGR